MNRAKLLLGGVAAMLLGIAGLVVAIPADQKLGELLKLVLFHGASTWANLVAFSLTAVLAAAFLLTRSEGVWRWESAFRTIAVPLWVVNTGLGVLSMYLSWGGFLWSEPRMRMTLWILLASFAVVAVHLAFERPRLTALFDIALAVVVFGSIGLTPKVFHPDNPVMHSGGTIIALFGGLVAACTIAALLGGALLAGRTRAVRP